MKMPKTLFKKAGYLVKKYQAIRKGPISGKKPVLSFLKYLHINFLLRVLNKEVSFTFLDRIKVKAKKGDGITGDYYAYLQDPVDSIFLMHYLNESDVFLDVGANVGHYSLLASVMANCGTISIEPIRSTFRRLKQNLTLNGVLNKVTALNIGLSDKPGKLYFSELLYTTNTVNTGKRGAEVEVKTIDQICEKKKINVIKIDVEGYEWFVLKGAPGVLNSPELKVIMIELNGSSKKFNVEEAFVIQFLKDHGFLPYAYDIISRELVPLSDKNADEFNTLFIKDVEFVKRRVLNAPKIRIAGHYV